MIKSIRRSQLAVTLHWVLHIAVTFVVCFSCTNVKAQKAPVSNKQHRVPRWAQEAIWYQIFIERFRNGDPTNDPSLQDMVGAWPNSQPNGWSPTPWGHAWYEQEEWARASGQDFYKTVVMRRYGGDLQGVIDKLDYLKKLGVTAIYFNPLNDAPSLHKYDARNYRHIDRNLGPDPIGDLRLMQSESPTDPTTWKFSSADRLFLRLINEVHQRKMRLIMDYSWNHTGTEFWAWQDIVRHQANSRFASWYEIEEFDDPATSKNEFNYRGWSGVKSLPEWKRVKRSDGQMDLHPQVKRLAEQVTRRWLDPNGDGDTSDGVDGFRLDVAAEVPRTFWADYRDFVKSINPDALLVGEIWWKQWPVKLADPTQWLNTGLFDSVMNYRWYVAARGLLANGLPRESPSSYAEAWRERNQGTSLASQRAMMNLISGHDSPRVQTSLFNPGLYKYRTNPRADKGYRIGKPSGVIESYKMLLVHQFTSVGAPHIYYGDEVGMWGADDPDCRKPMIWDDLKYAPEKNGPFGDKHASQIVEVDHKLLAFYQFLTKLRREHANLFVHGRFQFEMIDDRKQILSYRRSQGDEFAMVVFNLSSNSREIEFPSDTYIDLLNEKTYKSHDGANCKLKVDARSVRVVKRVERNAPKTRPARQQEAVERN